jgi:signal transduction histidine kinase
MELRIGRMAEPDGRTEGRVQGVLSMGQGAFAAGADDVAARTAQGIVLSAYAPALGAVGILVGVISHVAWLFWTVAPRDQFVPWLVYMGCAIAALLAGFLVEATARPLKTHLAFWRTYVSLFVGASSLGIAASVWILLPGAGSTLQLYMVALYIWYLTVLLLATRGTNRLFAASVVFVTGSLVAFWLTHDVPMREPVVAFLALFALTTQLLQHAMHRTVRDAITARYLAEDAHLKLQAALAEVSAERDAKARFIAAASHDLQQPIHAARLYFDQLATAKPPAQSRILAGGREAFRAVQTLLEDMLEHLRLEAGAVTVRPEPIALEPLYEELALQYAPAASAAGIRIVTQRTACIALADRRLLRRALGNLIDNAIKHSGGRRIDVSAAAGAGDTLEIRVRDDGRGISAENAARLFEQDFAFRRASGSSAPGFGLGLPSARRIADLFGGTLHLAPGADGGDFRLVLPRAAAPLS